MMRVTNSMIVKRTKTNINSNRAKVDHTNNQMSIQKKITKPSDNPIIAIRSLRLRSTLSTITQYYDNNIPDGLYADGNAEYERPDYRCLQTDGIWSE